MLFNNTDDIMDYSLKYFSSEPLVVQKYIENPFLINKKKRKEWEEKYGDDYNNDGTLKKNKQTQKRGDRRNLSMGGMMPMDQQRKVNPTTGLSMNKGGMMDMRKTGMFYGGMTSKRGK